MLDLKAKPFYLNEEDIAWVQEPLASMTLEQKAGQVFCPMGFTACAEGAALGLKL